VGDKKTKSSESNGRKNFAHLFIYFFSFLISEFYQLKLRPTLEKLKQIYFFLQKYQYGGVASLYKNITV
jgi:hypothetical protein